MRRSCQRMYHSWFFSTPFCSIKEVYSLARSAAIWIIVRLSCLAVFGPEHALLEQRQVENAWQKARALKPDMFLLYVRSNTVRVSRVKKSGNQ